MVAVSPQLTRRAVYNGLTISAGLTPSGSGTTTIEGYLIRATATGINLDSWSSGTITIRNCLIYYNGNSTTGRGIFRGSVGPSIIIEDCMIINQAAPMVGPTQSTFQTGINLIGTNGVTIRRVTVVDAASSILLQNCLNGTVSSIESHTTRGPYPRGQAVQLQSCHDIAVSNCSDEPIPGISWSEDSFNNYGSYDCQWSNLCIPMQSDGTSGRGLVVEQLTSTNVTVDNCEFLRGYNGGYGGFEVSSGIVFTNMKFRDYNLFSVRGLPGSSNSGSTLCAQVVTAYNPTPGTYTSVSGVYDGLPSVTPDGATRTAGDNNIWFNENVSGTLQGSGTVTASVWTQTLSVIRNSFPWRATWCKPAVRFGPRIGSYWLPNFLTGGAGLYGSQLVSGAVACVLPGLYNYAPTSRVWNWYLNGALVSNDMNYVIPAGSSGKTLRTGEVVANSAGALAEQLSTVLTIA